LKYELHGQEIQSFGQFLPQTNIFSVKTKAHLWILSQNLKIWKNLGKQTLCITDPKYGLYDQEIQTFDQFLPQTVIFLVKPNPNTLDFEPKFEEKIGKNLCKPSLCITNLEYKICDQEIWSFG
jgi:hypothetical protein